MIRDWILVLLLSSATTVQATEPCRPIEGVDALLSSGRVLLLGEIHGTVESPSFALDVACHAAHATLDVVIGLELPPAGQSRVDTFLDSEGTEADRTAVLAGAFWQSSYQDGRASRAMFELMEGVRLLRSAELPVSVALFDASGSSGGQNRDRAMAHNLATIAADTTDAMLIVLTGNAHSRVTLGSHWNSQYEPMGYVLRHEISPDRIMALNAAHGGGSAWICAPDCGVSRLSGPHGNAPWTVEIDDATRPAGHQGWYHVGTITASPPAAGSLGDPSPESGVAEGPSSDTPTARRSVPKTDEASLPDDAPASDESVERRLSELEARLEGEWQAYDFGSRSETWEFRFDANRFHAAAGEDDWYKGRIAIRANGKPAQIDFAIEDCRCSYKGMTSQGIYYWDGDSIVIAAPQPGSPRPRRFDQQSGQMMLLRKLDEDR